MDKADYYYISHHKETDCEVWDTYTGILVTCEDCKYRYKECIQDRPDDWYCADGKRKETEDE